MSANIILSKEEIEQKIQRIAYQILETFGEEEPIILAGIGQNGFILCKKIHDKLTEIMPGTLLLCEVNINKQNPIETVTTSISSDLYQNNNVVLIDDVLNTGTTLIYAVRHFLNVPLKKLKTAVLVDRNHKKYPVKADFKGISLSTSTKEHVQVVFDHDTFFAILE
jgi:pyrimidine operon attenuation protein/uracil phosphoribosyltransferase